MLENWIWEPAVLHKLSGHYTDTANKKLSEDQIKKMISLRHMNSGIFYKRHCFTALFDMDIHSGSLLSDQSKIKGGADDAIIGGSEEEAKEGAKAISALWADMKKRMTYMDTVEDTNPVATFYHLVMGYDAGYYGTSLSSLRKEKAARECESVRETRDLTRERAAE